MGDVRVIQIEPEDYPALLKRARIIAVFVQVGDDLGLMVNSDKRLSQIEKAALLEAATALETRD